MASIIERIDFDCPINLMLAVISLTAPLFCFVAEYEGYASGEPAKIVRNEILLRIGASVIGWVFGLVLMR